MHVIQEKLLQLSKEQDIMSMTLAELGQSVGVTHPQIVKHHRDQLVKNGLLSEKLRPNAAISSRAKGALGKADLISIPIMGAANAGPATIYADGTVKGYLKISSTLLPSRIPVDELFALEAVGMSMNRAKINQKSSIDSGDYIIADKRTFNPKNGDYVVSLIDGMANIKKFVFDRINRQIALVSESSEDYPPIFIHEDDTIDYVVQAKVVQVVKIPK